MAYESYAAFLDALEQAGELTPGSQPPPGPARPRAPPRPAPRPAMARACLARAIAGNGFSMQHGAGSQKLLLKLARFWLTMNQAA